MNAYWTQRATRLRERIREAAARLEEETGETMELPDKLDYYRPPPLVRDASFEVQGEWMDLNPTIAEWWETVNSQPAWRAMPDFVGARVAPFAFPFKGTTDFTEVTLGEMANKNKGQPEEIEIRDGVNLSAAPRKITPDEKPVFFDRVFNSQAGVTHDWHLTFRGVRLVPTDGLSRLDLARWFDYEDEGNVFLEFDRWLKPTPLRQIIDYE